MTSLETVWQQNLEKGVLAFPRCRQCQTWNWYPLPCCKQCQGDGFEWVEVALEGRIHSWTRVHRNFSGQTMPALPYTIGIIEPSEALGLHIPCFYAGGEEPSLAVDTKVRLQPHHYEGRVFWSFVF